MIAAIALLDKIKNIKCHVSKKRKRNMYNFASTIKSKHEYKILPRSKPKVLQRKTELSTVVSHIYVYDRAKTLSFILLIRRKSTEFENESNV